MREISIRIFSWIIMVDKFNCMSDQLVLLISEVPLRMEIF